MFIKDNVKRYWCKLLRHNHIWTEWPESPFYQGTWSCPKCKITHIIVVDTGRIYEH